jgi:hypothetical protein
LPGIDGNSTELKINRSPITDTDLLDLWYWLIASGDSGIQLDGPSIKPMITGSAPSFSPNGVSNMVAWLDANNVDGDNNSSNDPYGMSDSVLGKLGRLGS